MMVSPSATRAASTSDAEARRSLSQDGGGAQRSLAADDGAAAFDLDVRAHADQFLRVHEAVLENVFGDDRGAFGLRRQRHELRLHVGGEAGILLGGHVGGVNGLSPMTRT